jgi:hypothetical protein
MNGMVPRGRPLRRPLFAQVRRRSQWLAFLLATVIVTNWCVGVPVEAGVVEYGSESIFLQALEPGPFTERFGGLTPEQSLPSPLSFSGPSPANAYSYSVSVEGGFFPIENPGNPTQVWLSTQTAREVVTISSTGQPVTGIGGHFFLTDFSGAVIQGTIRASLSDGSFVELIDQLPTDFWGVTGTSPFTSLTLEYLGDSETDAYITVGSVSVGIAAVPEPSTLSMVAFGAGVILILARRRSRAICTLKEPLTAGS